MISCSLNQCTFACQLFYDCSSHLILTLKTAGVTCFLTKLSVAVKILNRCLRLKLQKQRIWLSLVHMQDRTDVHVLRMCTGHWCVLSCCEQLTLFVCQISSFTCKPVWELSVQPLLIPLMDLTGLNQVSCNLKLYCSLQGNPLFSWPSTLRDQRSEVKVSCRFKVVLKDTLAGRCCRWLTGSFCNVTSSCGHASV